jgi:hypothetical protein
MKVTQAVHCIWKGHTLSHVFRHVPDAPAWLRLQGFPTDRFNANSTIIYYDRTYDRYGAIEFTYAPRLCTYVLSVSS